MYRDRFPVVPGLGEFQKEAHCIPLPGWAGAGTLCIPDRDGGPQPAPASEGTQITSAQTQLCGVGLGRALLRTAGVPAKPTGLERGRSTRSGLFQPGGQGGAEACRLEGNTVSLVSGVKCPPAAGVGSLCYCLSWEPGSRGVVTPGDSVPSDHTQAAEARKWPLALCTEVSPGLGQRAQGRW